jgi:simple sugar transport system ATP-binding protein
VSAVAAIAPGRETDPVLQLEGITKEFGAIRALHDINLAISPGDVVGLMGDNGAGKSTLVKIIAGNFHPTHGTIRFDGETHRFDKPLDARRVGIEVVYQDLALANNVSAAANVFLGREMTRRVGPFKFLDHKAMNARAQRTWSNPCRADSGKRSPSPAPVSPTPG